MSAISAETYARRRAEDELRVDVEEPQALRDIVRALVFAGLLDTDVAASILLSHGRARELRGLASWLYPDREHHQSTQILDPARVARCSGEIDVSGETFIPRFVTLSAHRTGLAATIRAGSGAGPGRGRRPHGPAFREITLGDDKGRSVTARFFDRALGTLWSGWYRAEPGLSPDTVWIEVEGTRLALDDTNAGATVTLETLVTDQSPIEERATRYLEHCTQSSFYDPEPAPLALIADALVTCGAFPADSPAVTAALAAAEDDALREFRHRGRTGSQQSPQSPHTGRGRAAVIVGLTTPPLDGVSIRVNGLEPTPEGFEIEIDGVGPVEFGHGYVERVFARALSITGPTLAMRATDDRSNHYRGRPREFDLRPEAFTGSILFAPALDPNASAVDLEFSTERTRAIMHVPLPPDGRP